MRVLWGYICIIFIVLCKGNMRVKRRVIGGEGVIYMDVISVIIFDMGIYVGV